MTEEQVTNNILIKDEIAKIENRLFELKKRDNNNDDNDEGGSGEPPPPPPSGGGSAPPMREAEMDVSFRRPPGPPPHPLD